ncbi:2-amino-4-hydroxy-6-hydroxymethyldihydropteridine diphosphokinase [Microbacterium pygmaeum]|uniref:2-amino-4-hydroxy-6-hydroxymethyldihydropteridine diphosphokinase n=1 Tax=Microbacterium pygmaeum TaxID=370764 RepID=A0A1G7U3I0_9MICO|nr:2-amino-4-hydroxy-6-hydroxymethyldihydropteridine diphosphokinase [Microbacterium pygmaeum]SDG41821.1 2-amino-4-hydroxy-6-hydroxymethyldihydropteridinediphosphokinase [Microbacterium pygmaeum]
MSRRLAHGADGAPAPETRASVRAVIALGANLGDRAATLGHAVADLGRLPLTDDVLASAAIETIAMKPDGPDAAAPAYLNAVAIVTTRLAPTVLLAYLHAIEARYRRERAAVRSASDPGWEDRTLDLDLIVYGDVRSDDPALLLPHPRAGERDFVLIPWLSIDPDAELAGAGRIDELLAALQRDDGESA